MTEEEKLQRFLAPQEWNGYAYVGNSPVTYSDPTGMERYDNSVTGEEQKRIHQALLNISVYGDDKQQQAAALILASNILIQVVEGVPDGAQTTLANRDQAQAAIDRGPVSLADAAGLLKIQLNKSNVDDPSNKGGALLEGLLVHEGDHVSTDSRTISSLSNGEKPPFRKTKYQDEHDAYTSEAKYLKSRGGPYTGVGLKEKRSGGLLVERNGTIQVNEARIRQILAEKYRVTPQRPGPVDLESLHRRTAK
jgi:hypothetical protein